LEQEHALAPHLRILQKALANEITVRTHSEEALQTAIKTSDFLFGNGSLEFLKSLSDTEVLDVFDGVPQFKIAKAELTRGIHATDLLAEKSAVFTSKGEARKMIQGGGVSINKEKLGDAAQMFDVNHLINDKYLVVQKGKKNYFLLIIY